MGKRKGKSQWKKGRLSKQEREAAGSAATVTLSPDPVIKDITMGLAQQALALLDTDFGALLQGDPIKPVAPRAPRQFLELVLENASDYDLDAWPPDYLRAAAEIIAAHFVMACLDESIDAGRAVRRLTENRQPDQDPN